MVLYDLNGSVNQGLVLPAAIGGKKKKIKNAVSVVWASYTYRIVLLCTCEGSNRKFSYGQILFLHTFCPNFVSD